MIATSALGAKDFKENALSPVGSENKDKLTYTNEHFCFIFNDAQRNDSAATT
jgi:hypothetical protein